jgi:hypothetical protein
MKKKANWGLRLTPEELRPRHPEGAEGGGGNATQLMTEMKVGSAASRTPLHLLLRKRDFIDNTKGKTTVGNQKSRKNTDYSIAQRAGQAPMDTKSKRL